MVYTHPLGALKKKNPTFLTKRSSKDITDCGGLQGSHHLTVMCSWT